MEWVERVDASDASLAHELHPETISTSEFAFVLAELAIAISLHPTTFMPDSLVKARVAIVVHPQQEWVILATVSVHVDTTACERTYPGDIVLLRDVFLVSPFTKNLLVEVRRVKVGDEQVSRWQGRSLADGVDGHGYAPSIRGRVLGNGERLGF